MSKHLEDFVKNNREDFDKFEPGPVVWHNIQQQLTKPPRKGILISMQVLRWSAAAAIVLSLGVGVWLFMGNKKNPDGSMAVVNTQTDTSTAAARPNDSATAPVLADNQQAQQKQEAIGSQATKEEDDTYNEEMAHYARLVEIKQAQIKKIKNDEPLLYQQFAGDFHKLDSTFHILKKQLPVNPNREQILEAMIQNLQYQEALLTQQLNIIKKINNTKKEAYEKAYRSA
ncbi:MAG TPA: hypothetical protein VL307_17665 [Chitinophagaceae bacterium]|nr:hypothetical protein [Chitinophagaceae bacterium]